VEPLSIDITKRDAERLVDQFVDEVLDRLSALHALLDAEDRPMDTASARRAGQELIAQLRDGSDPDVADQLVDALWSAQRGGRPPASWLTTPLGGLVRDAIRVRATRHGRQRAVG
jgi:plasmid stability protein